MLSEEERSILCSDLLHEDAGLLGKKEDCCVEEYKAGEAFTESPVAVTLVQRNEFQYEYTSYGNGDRYKVIDLEVRLEATGTPYLNITVEQRLGLNHNYKEKDRNQKYSTLASDCWVSK